MHPTPKELTVFLESYNPAIQQLAMEVRELILSTTPNVYELIWDNYNALAIAYSTSKKLEDAYCHWAVYPNHINIGFNRGKELADSKRLLLGKGNLIRHYRIEDYKIVNQDYLRKLILDARLISEANNPNSLAPNFRLTSIVKSISDNRIRPIG